MVFLSMLAKSSKQESGSVPSWAPEVRTAECGNVPFCRRYDVTAEFVFLHFEHSARIKVI
jgi:hypothetical protein